MWRDGPQGARQDSSARNAVWLSLLVPLIFLVLQRLWLAFRRAAEVLVGLSVLLLGGLCLRAVMRAAGWPWNLLDVMAIPLVLGTGVDYSLFLQPALL